MIKLYKHTPAGLAYHEAWTSEGAIIEHWGLTGTRGESREHELESDDEDEALERVLAPARREGYEELDADDERILIVEYRIDGMGSPPDLEKRHRLEERLNETLGWTGLGECDGGSIGSGTMEVCCFVADFERAKAVIEAAFANTEYADFSRIYDEEADSG